MASFELVNGKVVDACNAAYALQMWLRPGLLAFVVGAHVEALRPVATNLLAERASMLDEAALRHSDVYPDGHADAGKPHPLAGQQVKRIDTTTGTALEIVVFKTKEAGAEYNRRVEELYAARATFEVPQRLTMNDIRRIEAERLPEPKGNPGGTSSSAVDFGALLPLVELPAPAPVAATP